MQHINTSILSTATLNEEVAVLALSNNVVLDMVPFIAIRERTDAALLHEIKKLSLQPLTVVFTSMHAAKAVLQPLGTVPAWNIFCTSGPTKAYIADTLGPHAVMGACASAAELAQAIMEKKDIQELTFFCGEARLDTLPGLLEQHGIKVNELTVYDTLATPVKLYKQYAAILFYSPSAVDSFFDSNTVEESTVLFAIGKTTAAAIRKYSTNLIVTSEYPNKEKMAVNAISYCNI